MTVLRENGFILPVGSPPTETTDPVVPGGLFRPTGNAPMGTRIAWTNELAENDSINVTSTGVSANTNDLLYLSDYMNTTRYSFGDRASVTSYRLTVSTGGPSKNFLMDHLGLIGVNWNDANITQVQITAVSQTNPLDDATRTSEVVYTQDVSNFDDNKVLMCHVNQIAPYEVYVDFTVGTATDEVSISLLTLGQSFEFPGLPDDGFQPGMYNNIDEQIALRTSVNQFGGVNIVEMGTEERYRFSLLPQEFMNNDWAPFIKAVKAGVQNPVLVSWNPMEFPLDAIYGRIDFNNASYSTRIHGTIAFNLGGIQGELI